MFVSRDGDNLITGAFYSRQPGRAEEELADNNSELLDFLNNNEFYRMSLNDYKTLCINKINDQIKDYVYSRYALHRQITLTNILLEATSTGKTNRAAYVGSVWTWTQSVFSYYYTLQNAIIAAADKTAVKAIVVDQSQLNTFTAADPVRTIEAAMAISN